MNLRFMFQVSSMDQFLKVQEHLGAELQKQVKTLSDSDEEHKKMNEKKSEELKQLEEKLNDLQSHTEETEKQLSEAKTQILSLEKQKAELENAAKEAKKEAEVQDFTFLKKFSLIGSTYVVTYTTGCTSYK